MDHSPDYFVTDTLNFNYEPHLEVNIPKFQDYLSSLCNYDEQKKRFIQAWMKCLINSKYHLQVFFYLMGPGGTDKSVLENICKALIGINNKVSTIFSLLNNNTFELTNLKNKTLVAISDSEKYHGPTTQLKNLTENDRLRGRIKQVQGEFDFYYYGLVIITADYQLEVIDSSGAVERRMRLMKTDNVVPEKEQQKLLVWGHKKWEGTLVDELPGIFKCLMKPDAVSCFIYTIFLGVQVGI